MIREPTGHGVTNSEATNYYDYRSILSINYWGIRTNSNREYNIVD